MTLSSWAYCNHIMYKKLYCFATHTHTCRRFPLCSRSEWTIAEGCETISSLTRFDISIVSIDQDLPQSFSLSVETDVKKWSSSCVMSLKQIWTQTQFNCVAVRKLWVHLIAQKVSHQKAQKAGKCVKCKIKYLLLRLHSYTWEPIPI